jgi:hypothetical protein
MSSYHFCSAAPVGHKVSKASKNNDRGDKWNHLYSSTSPKTLKISYYDGFARVSHNIRLLALVQLRTTGMICDIMP